MLKSVKQLGEANDQEEQIIGVLKQHEGKAHGLGRMYIGLGDCWVTQEVWAKMIAWSERQTVEPAIDGIASYEST